MNLKYIVLACLLAVATARPDSYGSSGSVSHNDLIEIIRDDRVNPEDGSYSFSIETEDGIIRSESGSPLNIEENPTGQQGSVAFTFPDGQQFNLKFVANEGGYQPESSFLPVAPEFPHPIPNFVLEQIEKAKHEDAEAVRSAPKSKYA